MKLVLKTILFLSLAIGSFTSSAVAQGAMACHTQVQASIGPDGFVGLTPQMLLSDPQTNYSPFEVSIMGRTGDTVFCSDMRKPVMATVTDTRNGNSCWSTVFVEDKLPPRIQCRNDTFPCYVDRDTIDYLQFVSATDNCDQDVEIFFSEVIDDLFCDPWFSARVDLEYTATDDQGLTASCKSSIFFKKIDIRDTEFPEDTTVFCPIIDSLDVGVPLLDSLPISVLCEYVNFFSDDTIPGRCSGEFTIERTWTVMDWCPGGRTVTDLQSIFVRDTTGPVIACPDTTIVGTTPTTCTGIYIIPPVIVSDACGVDSLIDTTFRLDGGPFYDTGDTLILDTGVYTFICTAEDDCGNITECEHIVQVIDDVAPTLICIPNDTFYLDTNGFAKVCLKDYDHLNYYFDNCGIDSVSISKMDERCDTTLNPYPGFCVTFCCEEVLQEVMVIITVTDLSGNQNFCMINTAVLDTIPPDIIESPGDTTIPCTVDYRDTSLTGGRVVIEDNCLGVLTLKIVDSVDIDACLTGVVIRSFIACDPSGNADTAIQIITITNSFVFDSTAILWPQDTCIETCPPDSLPETIGSMPEIPGDSCGVVMISYSDRDISDTMDACLIIERTWTVRNECRDTFEMDSIQIITIKNYRPPVLSGPPLDTTVIADMDSCEAFVTLPELVATDCTTGLTVSNDCTGGGAIVTGRFPVGTKVITYTATDACGNVSTYQTILRVIDMSGPSITCPNDTTVNCGTRTDTATLGNAIANDNCVDPGLLTITFMDDITPGSCPQEFTIERTFTATDTSGNMSTCIQIIEVQDTVAPAIICPSDITVSCEDPTTPDVLGRATATDECQDTVVNITSRDSLIPGSCQDEMTIFRIFTATDSCGNSSSCTQRIMVIDTTPPVIMCPADIIVSCGDMTGPEFTGEPTATDNCDLDITFTRQDSIIPGMGQTFRTIFRLWIAMDNCGNLDSCEQVITVRDTEPPSIVCPPDTMVPCSTDISDLSVFGGPDAMDNCSGVIVTSDTIFDLNICNVGTITRIFFATDSVGNRSSCEQVVTITYEDTLAEGDIIWPDSIIEVDACIGIDPDSIPRGRPMIDSTAASCFRISQTFVDTIDYDCVPGVCSTLTRKWTLVDSCQLDTATGQGIFCFTQEIRVVDTMPPTIFGPMSDTIYLHPDSACEAFVRLMATADDCSGIRSLCNFVNFRTPVKDTGGVVVELFPRGCTPVSWLAEDSCCNTDTFRIDICVLDTIPPIIDCRDLEKNLMGELGTEMAEFCVSELIIRARDNCDPRRDLRVSFDPLDPSDTCRVYNCDSLAGSPTLNRMLTLYITDASGNVQTCVSTITVRDRVGICMGTIVGGAVRSIRGDGIENAQVELMGYNMMDMTDANGAYSFNDLNRGVPYDIEVSRDEEDALNGIGLVDILLIYQHLLGIREFDSPYQYLAADVNGNARLQVSDIVEIRKLLMGRQIEFPNVPHWYFVDGSYSFDPFLHPLEQPEAFNYHIDTLKSHMNIGFVGVKSGDVNGDAKTNSLLSNKTRSLPKATIDVQQMPEHLSTEDQIAYIKWSSEITPGAMSYELAFNSDLFEIEAVDLAYDGNEEVDWKVEGGQLRILWVDALNQGGGDQLELAIKYKVFLENEESLIQMGASKAQLVDQNLNEYIVEFQSSESSANNERMILSQNRPNPFNQNTVIGVYLPAADNVTLEISTPDGRMVWQRDIRLNVGWNHIEIDANDLPSKGMYMYKLSSTYGVDIKKMLMMY